MHGGLRGNMGMMIQFPILEEPSPAVGSDFGVKTGVSAKPLWVVWGLGSPAFASSALERIRVRALILLCSMALGTYF